MRVETVEVFLLPADERPELWCRIKPFLFVKVTAGGLVGWGEAYTLAGREASTARLLGDLGDWMAGRDATRIALFTRDAVALYAANRAGIEFHAALSALETALWDLAGKALAVPVHRLLGGACRDAVPLYANCWSDRPRGHDAMAARAAQAIAAGFAGVKIYPRIHAENEAAMVEQVRAVRQAIGDQARLMVDWGRSDDPEQALRLARALEPYGLFWLEDPVLLDNLAVVARLRGAMTQPLNTGETLVGKGQFQALLDAGAAAIVNPDVALCGGILEMTQIAALAAPHLVPLTAHNYNSMAVGLAATLQAAAAIPNFLVAEYFPSFAARTEGLIAEDLTPAGGLLALPEGPGLGITLDEAFLASRAAAL